MPDKPSPLKGNDAKVDTDATEVSSEDIAKEIANVKIAEPELEPEPLLVENKNRFVLFPIKYQR
jgi:hypothetical protein